ncbi:MAG: cytochrome P460 family protein [Myxococcales bacterium]|nr:cytochrome P460 family protein [Myxococcales bacterium]
MTSNRTRSLCRAALCAGALCALPACGGDDDDPATDGDAASADAGGSPDAAAGGGGFDEMATVAAARDFAGGGFTRVSADAVPSQHASAQVIVWANGPALDPYLSVMPDDGDARPDFPAGSILVKEQQKDDGSPDAITVMAKADPGSDPERDDWWWARVENDGRVSFSGQVDFCIDCHRPRADVGWVFGVPPANRRE